MDSKPSSRYLIDGRVAAAADAGTPYSQTPHHISTADEARFVSCTFIFLNFFVLKIILVFGIDD